MEADFRRERIGIMFIDIDDSSAAPAPPLARATCPAGNRLFRGRQQAAGGKVGNPFRAPL
jgi:hypothetical protein